MCSFIYLDISHRQVKFIHIHTENHADTDGMLLPLQLKSSLENLMNAFTKTWKIFHAHLKAKEFDLKCKVTEKIDCILKHGEVHLKLMCATFVHVCAVCSCHWTNKRQKIVTPILFKPLAFYLWIASPTSGNALWVFLRNACKLTCIGWLPRELDPNLVPCSALTPHKKLPHNLTAILNNTDLS